MAEVIKSIQIPSGTRVYYIDLREDTKGGKYITLTEIPTKDKHSKKKRARIFIHENHLDRIVKGLMEINDEIGCLDKC